MIIEFVIFIIVLIALAWLFSFLSGDHPATAKCRCGRLVAYGIRGGDYRECCKRLSAQCNYCYAKAHRPERLTAERLSSTYKDQTHVAK